jgi:hypothetical protein
MGLLPRVLNTRAFIGVDASVSSDTSISWCLLFPVVHSGSGHTADRSRVPILSLASRRFTHS